MLAEVFLSGLQHHLLRQCTHVLSAAKRHQLTLQDTNYTSEVGTTHPALSSDKQGTRQTQHLVTTPLSFTSFGVGS